MIEPLQSGEREVLDLPTIIPSGPRPGVVPLEPGGIGGTRNPLELPSFYSPTATSYDGYDISVEYIYDSGVVRHPTLSGTSPETMWIPAHQAVTEKLIRFEGIRDGDYPEVPSPALYLAQDPNLVLLSVNIVTKPIVTAKGAPTRFWLAGTYRFGFHVSWVPGAALDVPNNPLTTLQSPPVPPV